MRVVRTTLLGALLLAGACVSLASCQAPNGAGAGAGPTPAASQGDVGSVAFELTLAGKFELDSLSYDITGNGFHRAATVSVASASTISTLVSSVPFGTGYVATLTAQDAAGKLTPCAGSATFDITSAGTVSVPVHMSCSVVHQTTTGGGGAGTGGGGGAGTGGGGGAGTGGGGGAGTGGGGSSGAGGAGGGGSGPPSVPVPRGAGYALAALLAALGASRLRRRSS
jgi:hypothetical protein